MSRQQSGLSLEDGKENQAGVPAASQKPQRWRAAVAFRERGKLFTPRKAASSKMFHLRDSSNHGSSSDALQGSQSHRAETRSQGNSLPSSDCENSSKAGSKSSGRGASSKEGTNKQDDGDEVNSVRTPAKGQGYSRSQKALSRKSLSSKSMQPSNAGCSTPTAAAAPSTVSKLWSILKSGAKRGLTNRTADPSSSPGK